MSNLDKLIEEYNLLFESVTNVGEHVVCYERDVWDALRVKFGEIVAVELGEKLPEGKAQ